MHNKVGISIDRKRLTVAIIVGKTSRLRSSKKNKNLKFKKKQWRRHGVGVGVEEPTIKNDIYFSKRTIFTINRIPGISF